MKHTDIQKAIFFLIAGCLALNLFAQQEETEAPKPTQHSIGLNTIGFFNQLFNSDNMPSHSSPYLFTYTYAPDRVAFRAAIGPEYTSETTVHDGFSNSEEHTVLQLDARLGAGLVILDDRRWQAIAGVDGAVAYLRDRAINDSGFDRITTQTETKTFGAGPFLEVAFHLSRRISLSTESTCYWMHGTSENVELYKNFPDFNTVLNKTTISKLEITLPNTLFLRIHF